MLWVFAKFRNICFAFLIDKKRHDINETVINKSIVETIPEKKIATMCWAEIFKECAAHCRSRLSG